MTSDEAIQEAWEENRMWLGQDDELFKSGWKAALEWAKSGQEPVAYLFQDGTIVSEVDMEHFADKTGQSVKPLYTHPAPAQPAEVNHESLDYIVSVVLVKPNENGINTQNKLYPVSASSREEAHGIVLGMLETDFPDHKFHTICSYAIETEPTSQPAVVQQLVEALEWYQDQTRLARLIHSEGDEGRNALAKDGGDRAQAALAAYKESER